MRVRLTAVLLMLLISRKCGKGSTYLGISTSVCRCCYKAHYTDHTLCVERKSLQHIQTVSKRISTIVASSKIHIGSERAVLELRSTRSSRSIPTYTHNAADTDPSFLLTHTCACSTHIVRRPVFKCVCVA